MARLERLEDLGMRQVAPGGVAGVVSPSSTKVAPASIIAAPSAKVPSRSFGPWRSTRMPIGRFASRSIVRMASTFSGSFSRGRWLMSSRKTSTPARNSRSIISGELEAGPRVATIFVRRERFKRHPPDVFLHGQPVSIAESLFCLRV